MLLKNKHKQTLFIMQPFGIREYIKQEPRDILIGT